MKRRIRCECCKELFHSDNIGFTPDPFEQEINSDDTKHWLCSDCYSELSMEI